MATTKIDIGLYSLKTDFEGEGPRRVAASKISGFPSLTKVSSYDQGEFVTRTEISGLHKIIVKLVFVRDDKNGRPPGVAVLEGLERAKTLVKKLDENLRAETLNVIKPKEASK